MSRTRTGISRSGVFAMTTGSESGETSSTARVTQSVCRSSGRLVYTSDAADEEDSVVVCGRLIT